MALHFEVAEYRARISHLIARLKADGLAGILLFRQESMYYLTGYDTAGYSQFQGLYLGIDGRMVLLTRSSDVRQARLTSIIEDIRLWVDRAGANPAETLRDAIADRLSPQNRIGVEYARCGVSRCRAA
jgi:Xaa-Pro dipeptidase